MKYGLSGDIIERLQQIFTSYPQIEEVVLYGSRATGTFRKGSDIDLTLRGENVNFTVLTKIMAEVESCSIPYKVDLSVYQTIENAKLREHIAQYGKLFYAKAA